LIHFSQISSTEDGFASAEARGELLSRYENVSRRQEMVLKWLKDCQTVPSEYERAAVEGVQNPEDRYFSEALLCDPIWQDYISATTVWQILQDMQDNIDTTDAFMETSNKEATFGEKASTARWRASFVWIS
jgi:hypothetical protein